MSAISTVTIVSMICVALGVATNATLLIYAATGLGFVSLGLPLMGVAQALWTRGARPPAAAKPIGRALPQEA